MTVPSVVTGGLSTIELETNTMEHPLFLSGWRRSLALILGLSSLLIAWGEAAAHAGHAGKPVQFVAERMALKAMLPKKAHVVRRKQALSDPAIDWAMRTYGVELDDDVYTYYLARRPGGDGWLAAATIVEVPYRHGSAVIGVGIDGSGRLTRAVLLSINEKYVDAFESSVGSGVLPAYAGLTIGDLGARATASQGGDDAVRRLVDETVRDGAVLLMALTRGTR